MTDNAQAIYDEGKTEHEREGHEGTYAQCDEWTCLAYKARAAQLANEAEGDE